jgi:nucleoid DNA-binding protein
MALKPKVTKAQQDKAAQEKALKAQEKALKAQERAAKAAEAEEDQDNTFSDTFYYEMNKLGSYTRQDATNALKALQSATLEHLVQKGRCLVNNVGRFALSPRDEREGVNPRTRERVRIPASMGVSFRPAKAMKVALVDVKVPVLETSEETVAE